MWLLREKHEGLRHEPGDQAANRKSQDPRHDDLHGDSPTDRGEALGGADSHDRRVDRVRGAEGNAES